MQLAVGGVKQPAAVQPAAVQDLEAEGGEHVEAGLFKDYMIHKLASAVCSQAVVHVMGKGATCR